MCIRDRAESEGGATTIKFGIHVANPQEQEAVTYNIVQAFNEKYDGKYKVEFEASDKESHSKNMKLEASDGTLPQIFWLDASEAPEYSDSGVLMDLSDFLSENSDIQTALGGMENAFQDDNGQYGLPYPVSYTHLAQAENDVVRCNQIIMEAFETDVEPLLSVVRMELGLTDTNPLRNHRESGCLLYTSRCV